MWIVLYLALVAQPPAGDTLTLAEAVEVALANHEDARIAGWQYEQQAARRRQVLARLLPHANLAGSFAYRPELTVIDLSLEPGDYGYERTVPSQNIWTGRASISMNLVDLGAIPDLLRASRALEAQELATVEAKRLLGFAVAEQFLMVLAAEQLLAAAKERVEVANATVADAEARQRAGAGRPSDVTRAELERSTARLAAVEAERDIDLARIGLAELLGEGNRGLADRPLVPPEGSLLSFEPAPELGTRARRERSDLRQARLMVEAAQYAVWENLAGFLPRISVAGDVTKQNDGLYDRELEWTVAIGLSWSLYEGGYRLAEDSYREASAEIAALEEARLSRAADAEVRTALRRLTASQAQVEEATLQAQLAHKNRDETGAMFQHGLSTALERVDAIARAAEADAALARRELEGRLAELTVLRSIGAWPVEVEGSP